MMTASEKRRLLDHLRNSFDEVQAMTEKVFIIFFKIGVNFEKDNPNLLIKKLLITNYLYQNV
jgi:hypothetical protein